MREFSIKEIKRPNKKRVYHALGETVDGKWSQLVATGSPKTNLIYTRKSEALTALKWIQENIK